MVDLKDLPPVTADDGLSIADAVASRPFSDWWERFKKTKMTCEKIHVQSIDYFGKRVGFLKVKSVIKRADGTEVPGIIFMRGPAVGILVVLIAPDGKKYTLLTRQARPAIGEEHFLEIPAGMMDDAKGFCGKAAEEMEEETGIKIKTEDLVVFTDMYKDLGFQGMVPSAGGCDEQLGLCLYEKKVTEEELKKFMTDTEKRGVEEEQITIKVIPLRDLITATPDAKSICAMALYKHYLFK